MKLFKNLAILLLMNISLLSFGACPLLVEKSGTITSSETWTNDNLYLLKGIVFIEAPAVLTIQAGTIIHGDKPTKGLLVIKPGAQIIAIGTANAPIIFSSHQASGARDRGDWGGLIILGNAPVNKINPTVEGIAPHVIYGGINSTESSGTLQYVRIEYAGIALSPDNETNALTLAGVGSGTTIEYVQTSFGGDDGFECFGGTVNCKNIISYANWDDDFDVDFGYSGNIQYALALRDPLAADQTGSHAIEADNDAAASMDTPQTMAVFSNLTILGPRSDSATTISTNYQAGIFIRRNAAISVFNSVNTGFNEGININNFGVTFYNYTEESGVIDYNVIAMTNKGTITPLFHVGENGVNNTDVQTYCESTHNNTSIKISTNPANESNWIVTGISEGLFYNENIIYPADPDFTVTSGIISSGANFSNTKLTGGFFTTTTYRGAFGSSDWTDAWAEWNPQNAFHCYAFNNTTSIFNSKNDTKQFELYPNPTEGRFVISGNNEQTIMITLLNSQGVKLIDDEIITGQFFDLKEKGCSKGVYFIQLNTENKSELHKIILY